MRLTDPCHRRTLPFCYNDATCTLQDSQSATCACASDLPFSGIESGYTVKRSNGIKNIRRKEASRDTRSEKQKLMATILVCSFFDTATFLLLGDACDRLPCDGDSCTKVGAQLSRTLIEAQHEFNITPSDLDLSIVITNDALLDSVDIIVYNDYGGYNLLDVINDLESGLAHNFVYPMDIYNKRVQIRVRGASRTVTYTVEVLCFWRV